MLIHIGHYFATNVGPEGRITRSAPPIAWICGEIMTYCLLLTPTFYGGFCEPAAVKLSDACHLDNEGY